MEPHILDFDPRSGDYGLGFFGCSLQSGSYYVRHQALGGTAVCYLCNLATGPGGVATITPTDLYHNRVYLEPLALYLTLDTGTFASLALDLAGKSVCITFAPPASDGDVAYSSRRLRADKLSSARPGADFAIRGLKGKSRGAFEVPASQQTVELAWQ